MTNLDRAHTNSASRGLRVAASRAVDLFGSVAGLLVISPVLVLVAIGALLSTGRPIMFYSTRAGLAGGPFRLIKFRSMREGSEPDKARITDFGRLLRSTSLDELPALLNVLRGDMSLVGPRPLPIAYVDRYSPTQARRLEVKPAITGWAQIKGRNALTWVERFAPDVWYVDNRSLWLDLKILSLTVPAVSRRKGISPPVYATMPEFLGRESSDA